MLPLSLSSDVTSDGPNRKDCWKFCNYFFYFCGITFRVGSTYILAKNVWHIFLTEQWMCCASEGKNDSLYCCPPANGKITLPQQFNSYVEISEFRQNIWPCDNWYLLPSSHLRTEQFNFSFLRIHIHTQTHTCVCVYIYIYTHIYIYI
jgi:hypothetical protein